MGAFTNINLLNVIGWIVFIALIVGAGVYGYFWWKNKKTFNKQITALEIIGAYFEPTFTDRAKAVKIGSGGFEILFLKKLKVYKIGYGGRVGKSKYYFFIMPDGYWYNGMMYANVNAIDEKGGLIPIVTTNPLMRGQYTSLEKQIDILHKNKQKWWDEYGTWVLSIGFILVAGVMLWLNYKEYVTASGNFNLFADKMSVLLDKVNVLLGNAQGAGIGGSGLKPA